MFRRYPYWGWLMLSLLLWGINGYYYHGHRQNILPERMAGAVGRDLERREDAFNNFVSKPDIIRRMFTDSLTEQDVARLGELPFYIYCYDHNFLKSWNTNTVIAANSDSALGKPVMLTNAKGLFIQECLKLPGFDEHKRIVVLFPVLITCPTENDYLKSHFVASEYIPVTTKIIPGSGQVAGGYPVSLHNDVLFSLHFNPADIQKWMPDSLFILMLIAAVLASISWIHLMIIYLTRNRSSMMGFVITFSVIFIIRVSLNAYGIPFNLDTLLFFSPRLYASSSRLSSFGDLFIDTLCFLWLIIFITRHTPYRTYFDKFRGMPLRFGIALLLTVGMILYIYLFVSIIRSLVLDSNISFDVSHFSAINIYTILGLLVICAITGISCIVLYLFNTQLSLLIKSKWAKCLVIAGVSIALLLITDNHRDPFYFFLLGWLLLFIVLLDTEKLTLVSDLFDPRMVFWAVFICGFCTGVLQYFNEIKEKGERRAFVEQKLTPHEDNLMEYNLDKKVTKIEHDKLLKSFFTKPSAALRKIINQRFDTLYLNGAINKYDAVVYLFGTDNAPLFNKDSTDFDALADEKNESTPTSFSYLFYKESILDKHNYLSFIPIYSDTINNKIGYVVIDLGQKKQAAETVYPELLMPLSNKANPQENEYAYAVYVNNKLITEQGNYPFRTRLKVDTLKDQEPVFYNKDNVSELFYKVSDKRTIVVVHDQDKFLQYITIFSYLFCMQVVLAIVILLYQLYLSYFTGALSSLKIFRLTLRKRVHYSMLAIVFVSFMIIGGVTIGFFSSRYRASNSSKLESAMQVAKQSVQDQLTGANAFGANAVFDSIAQSNSFRYFITDIANKQKIDINVFDNNGNLLATSQDEIYQKGLISRIMRQDAFYQLNVEGKSNVLQNERVAGLSYLSAYEPLRDEHGITLGYINVPFFSSEKDLKFQISNIVITLINVYAFIFLISSLITVLITRWITGSFNMIIQQFGRINLQRNERIKWPFDDEIGLLVKEYNVMVNKVEENAALLAQSERESAWREMARQVAHEIKNPLTPMKLNIQFLQQAMRNDNPNIKELTNKVTASIVEQIDNLSYIASEFSNFAKMPEAKPEDIELRALLNKAAELYLNDEHVKVSITADTGDLFVFSDRSQLLRVFTNLLENAKQAIPASRAGRIDISLNTDHEHALIAITDNGEGISEEVSARIFQPYFTTKSSGTGLGLAMTRKIIEFWKGSIWFETKENEGTTFYIKLPLLEKVTLS